MITARPLASAAALGALAFILALAWAWATPFWFDEIFTVRIAGLPDTARMWDALRHGPELNPPLHYLAVRAAGASGQVTSRIPSALAFALGCAALCLFVSRRLGLAAGALAGLLPLLSGAFHYAYEARPYGLLFGSACVALLAWQGATSGSGRTRSAWLVLVSVSLCAALLSHCYALLVYLPLLVGELVRLRRDRRIDWMLAAALAAPSVCILTYVPLYLSSRSLAANSWAVPSLTRLSGAYLLMVQPLAWPVLVAAASLALWWHPGQRKSELKASKLPPHEIAAALVLLALPLAAFAMALGGTTFFHPRYAAPATAGAALLFAALCGRHRTVVPSLLLAAAAVTGTVLAVRARVEKGPPFARIAPPPCRLDASGLPVAVADGLLYLPLTRYADASLLPRMHFLLDHQAAVRFTGNDSIERGLEALAPHVPLQLEPYSAFLAAHPRFLMLRATNSDMAWLRQQLVAEGARIEPLPGCDTSRLLVEWSLVTRPAALPAVAVRGSSPTPATPPSPPAPSSAAP